ncbi:nickel pincer cofactor biosynthesis protein LarB [Candidatus Harpocratesius sp.]
MASLREILKQVKNGNIKIIDAEKTIKLDYIENLDNYAQLDLQRHHRTGVPEVIFSETKDNQTLIKITKRILEKNHFALLSRVTSSQFKILESNFSDRDEINYFPHPEGRIAMVVESSYSIPKNKGLVGIITAGSSDRQVAEEARLILHYMGYSCYKSYDIGIAGMHRIFPPLIEMISQNVNVIICVAGMEGTLPGVVASLVDVPVIGVPTSTGYGLGEKGIGALTTMLQSCSPGLAVVNIDNGFGAAVYASLIINQIINNEK